MTTLRYSPEIRREKKLIAGPCSGPAPRASPACAGRSTRPLHRSGNGVVMPRYVAFLRGVSPMNAKMPVVEALLRNRGLYRR